MASITYAKNSTFQRGVIDVAKQLMDEAIAEKLEIENLVSSKNFCIADLGCSVGPNTFTAVESIIEAVKFKYQSQGLNFKIPEFQVFFNDHVSNDFNLLFTSLPQDKHYYAAGIPGSFYCRLFPKASLHFVHSSFSVHWLSRAPKEVMNDNSPAWNKGQIHYANSGDEVIQAFKAQYEKDIEQFLQTRADEIVFGGLMVLIFLFNPNGIHPSQSIINLGFDLIGSSLMDLAKKGMVSEEKIDSFNLPIYITSHKELETAVERNGCFSIERMESLPQPQLEIENTGRHAHKMASHARAVMEGIIKKQFGDDILDELFDLYAKKLEEIQMPFLVNSSAKGGTLFVLLKRKA